MAAQWDDDPDFSCTNSTLFFGEKSTPTYDLGSDNLPEINDAFYMSMKYVKTLERFDVL